VKIEVIVFDGFDELDAIGPLEVLRSLAGSRSDVSVVLVAPEPVPKVLGTHGLSVEVEGGLDEDADLIVVSGGGWADGRDDGVRGELSRGLVPRQLAAAHARGATIAAVCTGALLLGAAGLLEGRPAITHHVAVEVLRGQGALIVEERVVDDGDLLTCGGVTAGLDLAFWLLEREFGAGVARTIATGMEYERRGGVYIGPGARG
jgi:transcriptional regulator GlxA family with amidase domain